MVSIIIPAYNAEKWIYRSVNSALSQTYKNIEVIVVENGSQDRTNDILTTIEDNRLRVLHSAKGVSNARNLGIENAKGNYIAFLDADDWLGKDAIDQMLSVCDEKTDVVTARYYGDKPFESYQIKRYDPGSEDYFLRCLYTPTKRGNVTGNLYKTNFIKNNKISFDDNLTNAEDSVFFIKVLLSNPVVVDLEKPVYHVFLNPESVTRKKINVDGFCDSISEVYRLLEDKSLKIKNGGYIFALNQLLVILVHNHTKIVNQVEFIRDICQKELFSEAIKNVDISDQVLTKRIFYKLFKSQKYLFIALIIRARTIENSLRSLLHNM